MRGWLTWGDLEREVGVYAMGKHAHDSECGDGSPGAIWRGKSGCTPWANMRMTVRELAAAVANVHCTTSVSCPFDSCTFLLSTAPEATSISSHLHPYQPC